MIFSDLKTKLCLVNNMIELKSYEQDILDFLGEKDEVVKVQAISQALNLKNETVNSVCESLKAKNLINIQSIEYELLELTEEGKKYAIQGLPERRILSLFQEEIKLEQLRENEELSKKELKIGIGWLKKREIIDIKEGYVKKSKSKEQIGQFPEETVITHLHEEGVISSAELEISNKESVLSRLTKRNIIKIRENKVKKAQLTDKGRKVFRGKTKVKKTVSTLTSEMLRRGTWKEATFSEYDVTLPSYELYPGKQHPYRSIIDDLREILIGMGFQEAKGPYVELNFWNCDALFMPSDHPARGVHDTFQVKHPSHGTIPDKKLWERVKQTHENGWETKSKGWGFWDPKLAKRLVLRSQTTPVSVRSLAELSEKDLPAKIFTIDRNFRPDEIDSSHFIEFYQCEGIVVDEDLNFRNLLWYLKKIANELGFEDDEVWFKPGYFPFTEPSVEGFVKISGLGWVEALPGGIFRPEVTKPLGIDVPVLAWGIGIDRLAMKKLEISDIREAVFTSDLETLRKKKKIIL